jgi:hypothetical protein
MPLPPAPVYAQVKRQVALLGFGFTQARRDAPPAWTEKAALVPDAVPSLALNVLAVSALTSVTDTVATPDANVSGEAGSTGVAPLGLTPAVDDTVTAWLPLKVVRVPPPSRAVIVTWNDVPAVCVEMEENT